MSTNHQPQSRWRPLSSVGVSGWRKLREHGTLMALLALLIFNALIIPTVIDQNPCAHLRMPRDMIFHGWSMRLFQAWQHSATMSS